MMNGTESAVHNRYKMNVYIELGADASVVSIDGIKKQVSGRLDRHPETVVIDKTNCTYGRLI